MSKTSSLIDFFKEIYRFWITERPNQLAAALAYYGMFSFAPVIYIAITVAGIFLNEVNISNRLYTRLETVFGSEIAGFIQVSVQKLSAETSQTSLLASLISFFALLFAASGVFLQLQFVLNKIWGVPRPGRGETRAFLFSRISSFLIVIGLGLFLVLSTAVGVVLTWLDSVLKIEPISTGFGLLGFVILGTVTFALFYKLLPNTSIAWRDVWLGSGLAALLMGIGGLLVGWFLKSSNFNSAFEAAGAFAVVLIGIYYMAQIFLFGAIFTRIYAQQFGSRKRKE